MDNFESEKKKQKKTRKNKMKKSNISTKRQQTIANK